MIHHNASRQTLRALRLGILTGSFADKIRNFGRSKLQWRDTQAEFPESVTSGFGHTQKIGCTSFFVRRAASLPRRRTAKRLKVLAMDVSALKLPDGLKRLEMSGSSAVPRSGGTFGAVEAALQSDTFFCPAPKSRFLYLFD
jgi:hypothetical protein